MLRLELLGFFLKGFLKSRLVSVIKSRGRWFLWLTDCSGHLDGEDADSVTALSSFLVIIMEPKSTAFIPCSYLGCGKFRLGSLRSTKLFKRYSAGTLALAAKI